MRKSSPGNWWSLGDAEAIDVGHVTVGASDGSLGWATAVFTVPQLPPARYRLMLCDTACVEPLGDVIPTGDFAVVADRATAQMAERVERLSRRSRNQAGRLAAARADADKALLAARTARSDVEQLQAGLSSRAEEGRSSPPTSACAYAGWLVAGALAGALVLPVLRRRRSRPLRARVGGWQPSDEEVRELLSFESTLARSPTAPARAERQSAVCAGASTGVPQGLGWERGILRRWLAVGTNRLGCWFTARSSDRRAGRRLQRGLTGAGAPSWSRRWSASPRLPRRNGVT